MSPAHVHVDSVPWQAAAGPQRGPFRWKELLSPARADAREFIFGLAEVAPGGRVPLHTHRHPMIHYVLSGTGRTRLAATSIEVSRDSCVYFPGGIPHATESLGAGPLRYLYTYACERLGPELDWRPSDEGAAGRAALPRKTWMRWEETADWRPIEPEKGLKVRYRRVMDPDKKVEMIAGIAEFDPGVHYTRHYHDQPELYYILAGRGLVYVGDSEVEVSPGSSVYIGSRVVHGADSLGTESLRLLYVYACETTGHTINWTPVEDIYTEARRR